MVSEYSREFLGVAIGDSLIETPNIANDTIGDLRIYDLNSHDDSRLVMVHTLSRRIFSLVIEFHDDFIFRDCF